MSGKDKNMEQKNSPNGVFLSKEFVLECFADYCKEKELPCSNEQFESFLNFLSVDAYDWIQSNLNEFEF